MARMSDNGAAAFGRTAIVLIGTYAAAQMISDIASLKIASIGGLAVDAGTFIYPITFTLRDLIHKRLGKSAARTTIILAAAVNLFMAGYLAFTARLPSDAFWDGSVPGASLGEAFALVLAPAWTIVIASIAAEVVSELVDTEAYALWTKRMGSRLQWTRVLVSNAVSVPLDSLVFSWLAFGWSMDAASVWQIFWFNVAVKGAVTLASLPGIYLVKERSEA